jgi:pyrroloquinoline quinone biosynthesis protein D
MKRCNGEASIADITADLERTFDTTGLAGDVMAFVSMAVAKRWLRIPT